MSKDLARASFRIVLPGLVAGGLCGAAVGLGYVAPAWGIAGAIVVALFVAVNVLRTRRRFKG
jgi:hypothetical protein